MFLIMAAVLLGRFLVRLYREPHRPDGPRGELVLQWANRRRGEDRSINLSL
jgi:hypothetical protein